MKTFLWMMTGLLALGTVSCAPRKIRGTNLDDTGETRAILETIEKYRSALENRDSTKLLALISTKFRDNGGTSDPKDDLDYDRLKETLPNRMTQWSEVRVDISVRRIELLPEEKAARVIYTFNSSYKIPGVTNRAHEDFDIKDMYLLRENDTWKIAAGI